MSIDFYPRVAAATLGVAIGTTMLTGCTPEYEGWTGCDQAMLTPGASSIRAAINQTIIEHNGGSEELNDGSMHYDDNTLTDLAKALHQVYPKAYSAKYVAPQAGDKLPFCVTKVDGKGEVSADKKGKLVVKSQEYRLLGDSWKSYKK